MSTEAGRRAMAFADLDRRRVDAALEAFYRAHILSVYHSPKGQAEYLIGQKLHDGMRSWRPAIEAAVAALGPVQADAIEAEAAAEAVRQERERIVAAVGTEPPADSDYEAGVWAEWRRVLAIVRGES